MGDKWGGSGSHPHATPKDSIAVHDSISLIGDSAFISRGKHTSVHPLPDLFHRSSTTSGSIGSEEPKNIFSRSPPAAALIPNGDNTH